MFKAVSLFSFLSLFSQFVLADQFCLDIHGSKKASLSIEQGEPEDIKLMQKLLDDFIRLAKQSDAPNFDNNLLVNKFSKFDSSQNHLQKEMNVIAGKFSLYKNIDSANVVQAFEWGNYKLAVVEYGFSGALIPEAQAFFCTPSGCQLSNIFERAKTPEKLILRFFNQLKFNNWKADNCPTKPATFSVTPTVNATNNGNPLDVFIQTEPALSFNDLKEGVAPTSENVLKANMGSFYRCVEHARRFTNDELYADPSQGIVKDFLSDCAVNMTIANLVPVMRGNTLTYIPPASLMGVFQDADIKSLGRITEKTVTYQVYGVVEQERVSTFFVLPIVGGSNAKIDWEYYDLDQVHYLLTEGFKRLVVN
jgi:hypothetical protein